MYLSDRTMSRNHAIKSTEEYTIQVLCGVWGDLANIKNTEEVKIKLSKSITLCGSSASRQMSKTHIQFN